MPKPGEDKPKRLVTCPECDTEVNLEEVDDCPKCGLDVELAYQRFRLNKAVKKLEERAANDLAPAKRKRDKSDLI